MLICLCHVNAHDLKKAIVIFYLSPLLISFYVCCSKDRSNVMFVSYLYENDLRHENENFSLIKLLLNDLWKCLDHRTL